ncbi:gliding motility-associated C-terminal domain-containing protein [Hymenobacter aquaticus]|uniref:Gliding motility-associated C-terminal domain-containing protein n=1 Tax=Hymenobacter aquaticus TaxID=1867101 RepID=A0A4Z0Q5N1_9BACT|nr:gliding motility-associated C-terminal domain-containing protein [Hymenobacter aquaticus]TGE24975.1 gliding motility-associated C-terminal domain-containing protein [Hymenobacter aquaticus]
MRLSFTLISGRAVGALLLVLALLRPGAASATHIVGGEMELQHRTGSLYTLTLNLYFDAVNGNAGALDQQMPASIFDKATQRRMLDVVLPLVSNTFVQYTNPACTQPTLSTRKLVYSRDVTLDAATYASASGYYASVERCCRNLGIRNIVNPGGAAQTFYLEFPAVVRGGQPFLDSTPRIFPPLGDYACRGELFYYDFGGQDADGDSLAYDLVTPLNGHTTANNPGPITPQAAPYSTVIWATGLSAQNQIPGTPALGIDARTGRLTVRPSQLGLFVFGVRCSEYRRGVKIGETRRDFQLYVLSCSVNAAPSVQLFPTASARAYQPGRDTLRLRPGTDHCLQVRFTDPDPSSQLTVTAQPVNFTSGSPGPTFTTATSGTVRAAGAPDTLTATLCFPGCQDTQGKVYLLDLIVADNGCSLPKRDTVRLAFTAEPAPNTPPVLTSSFPLPAVPETTPRIVRLPVGSGYAATLTGTDADGDALVLSATGRGFNLPAAGMSFGAQNGSGRATGTFRWQASCEAAQLGRLLVDFRLAESAACDAQPQLLTVQFEVVPTTDSVSFRPPNIITPNGDGINDVFALPTLPPDYCGAQFAGIRIFSRWGNEVYHSPDRSFQWQGSGIAGTYFYLITYTDGRRYKGWLEVAP